MAIFKYFAQSTFQLFHLNFTDKKFAERNQTLCTLSGRDSKSQCGECRTECISEGVGWTCELHCTGGGIQ